MPPGLNYVDVEDFAISRKRAGRGWAYYDARRKRITDRDEIDRLNRLALPPAYTEARFCLDPKGHLQAFGTDARGRRQYRYHPDFRAAQEEAKFGCCGDFGAALPLIRKRVEQDLTGKPLAYETVLAAIVRILDSAHLRVGNEEYAKTNKSFGVTTLRNRHAKTERSAVQLRYRGKGGLERSVRLNDKSLARVVRRCQDLPGQALFQYEDDDGGIHRITSGDVNDYIRAASGGDFTAKHFRTWAASVIGFAAMARGAKLIELLEEVSQALGNTPAIARKSYIHPTIIENAKAGYKGKNDMLRATKWLDREERGLLEYLKRQR